MQNTLCTCLLSPAEVVTGAGVPGGSLPGNRHPQFSDRHPEEKTFGEQDKAPSTYSCGTGSRRDFASLQLVRRPCPHPICATLQLKDLVDDLTRKLEDVTRLYYGFPSTTSLQQFIESRADSVLTGKDVATFLSPTDSLPSTNRLNMTSRSADQPPFDFCVIDNAVAAACPPPSALRCLAHVGTSSPSTINPLPTIAHKVSATISFNAKYLRSLRSAKGKGVSRATSASSPPLNPH